MTRERFLGTLLGLATLPLAACSEPAGPAGTDGGAEAADGLDTSTLEKAEAEWRALLSPAAFAVLFEEWTEPAGSSPLTNERGAGTYLCAACFVPLFPSMWKYDSGTGWPTFSSPFEERLDYKTDLTLIQPRTEYHCRRCGGHQGHVFEDGPPPTGLRYCNNGLALRFVPAGEALPALRT